MSLYDYMPPYHYDTEDFGQLRLAYDALESDILLSQSILDTATTPGKWNTEILNEMIAITGYSDYIQYLKTDAERREFLFYYLTNMRLMTEAAFAKHVELAFGKWSSLTLATGGTSGGTWPNGRNSTDFEPEWLYLIPIVPKYTITINNSRNVYVKVDCDDFACEFYTPSNENTYTLAYDHLIAHISETFPIGFRLMLNVELRPVGSDNEIYIGAVSTNTDEQYSETGDSANIYPQTYVYRLLGADDPPSNNDVLTADWTGTTNPLRFYVEGLWYDADDLEAHGYSMTRTGFHVPLTQTTLDQYVGSFSIPEGIDLTEPTYLAIRGGFYLRVRFGGAAPNKSTPGDWRWLKNLEPDLADAEFVYNESQDRTYYTGFTGTFVYVYINTWTPVQFYSESRSHSLPYSIDTQNRILYLSEWGVFRHTNPLELYGSTMIEPSSAVVWINDNGKMTQKMKLTPLIDTASGVSMNLGSVNAYASLPELDWTNAKSITTYYNTRDLDIVVWRYPTASTNNSQIGVFPKAPDASHVWAFEWDETTNPEVGDTAGRGVGFIPIAGGYIAKDYANDWPPDPSYTMNTRYSECDFDVEFPVPLDYQPSNTFTLKEREQ